jgi:hypothetical protein
LIENPFGVNPAIDIVTQWHDQIFRLWVNRVNQRFQREGTTVYITDRDRSAHHKNLQVDIAFMGADGGAGQLLSSCCQACHRDTDIVSPPYIASPT